MIYSLHPLTLTHPLTVSVLHCFIHVPLLATPWTVARQSSLSVGFSRRDTGVGCHALFPGIFPTQGLNVSCLIHVSYISCSGRWVLDHQLHLGRLTIIFLSSVIYLLMVTFLCVYLCIYSCFYHNIYLLCMIIDNNLCNYVPQLTDRLD